MCLNINDKSIAKTKAARLKHPRGYMIGWKRLQFMYNRLTSPFQRTAYKTGVNKSDRESRQLSLGERSYSRINRGIHVYTSYEQARAFARSNEKIVPVKCYYRDLVMFGGRSYSKKNEAVFMKVTLTERAYKKAASPWL